MSCFLHLQVKTVREENGLQETIKSKTKEGANEPLTMGDLKSHRKMFNLIKNTFPQVTVSCVGSLRLGVASCFPFLCPSPTSYKSNRKNQTLKCVAWLNPMSRSCGLLCITVISNTMVTAHFCVVTRGQETEGLCLA